MLNPQVIINSTPTNSAAARSDTGAANGKTGDTFSSVLARHIEDTKTAAQPAKPASTQDNKTTKATQSPSTDTQNSQDPATSATPTLDATSVALASMLHGNHAQATVGIKQDKTAATTTSPDAATMVAGMFGNQSAAYAIANNSSTGKNAATNDIQGISSASGANVLAGISEQAGKGAVSEGPNTGKHPITGMEASTAKNTSAPKAMNLTASAATHKPGVNTARENSSMTPTPKADAASQPVLKSISGAESLKLNDIAGNPSGAAPSAQMSAETASSMIAANLTPDKAINVANTANTTIAAPLGSNAWPAEFAQKITWVSSQQNQVAELHLNPPDLGPMSVVLSVSDNQATAVFSSPHSAVREAIENAMPRLRESLAENGIMLGNASVNDQAPRDNGSSNYSNQRASSGIGTDNTIAPTLPSSLPVMSASRHNGMVDTFA